MRLPARSVSRNVSRKPPFIAVPGYHHCEPLQVDNRAGGNKRSRRHAAYVVTGIRELLRHAGDDVAERAKKEYDRVVERDGLKDDEIMEDQRRAARR